MGKYSKPQKSRKHKKINAIDPFYKGNRKTERGSTNLESFQQHILMYAAMRFVYTPHAYIARNLLGSQQTFSRKIHKNKDGEIREKTGTNVNQKHLEEQGFPQKLKDIMQWKERGIKKKRKKKSLGKSQGQLLAGGLERGMSRPLKPVPNFRQGRGESDKNFNRRVSRETEDVLFRNRLETQFQVEIEDMKDGQVKIRKEKNEKQKRRQEILKERKKEKGLKKKDNKMSGFESLTDKVQFGEVAMQPPTLTAKPRKSQMIDINRPGGRSLLLRDMMTAKHKSQPPVRNLKSSTRRHTQQIAVKREVGKTISRKKMAPVQKRIMDKERKNAIEMYRQMKKNRGK